MQLIRALQPAKQQTQHTKGRNGAVTNLIHTLRNYQTPKKVSPITGRNSEDDGRFNAYADALKAGDTHTCKTLRSDNKEDMVVLRKFDMIERMWLAEMSHYVREVQIVRRERDGWEKLAEGYRKKLEGDKTLPPFTTMIQRGNALLEQATEARVKHVDLEIPLGFTGVK